MRTRYDFAADDDGMRYICLVEPKSDFVLCLVGLHDWAKRLDELGIAHSGVTELR
jgi:hypothetical protein